MHEPPPPAEPAFAPPSPAERARWSALPPASIRIERSWDGLHSRRDGPVLSLHFGASELELTLDAPYHADPPPPAPPGSCPRLWEHEVVELFLLGHAERYLELELGPHGHYLVLRLAGVRQVREQGLPLPHYRAHIHGARWSARAHVPLAWLPPSWSRFNAYAIDGQGQHRRYWAHFPVPGPHPDFHRLHSFGPFEGAGPPAR